MAAKPTVSRLVYDIRITVLLAMGLATLPIANYKFGAGIWLPGLGLLVVRVLIVAVAGYIATNHTKMGLWGAALAGAIVFFAEQVLVGLWFIIDGQFTSAGSVVQSSVLFIWVALIVGAIGGLVGRVRNSRNSKGLGSP